MEYYEKKKFWIELEDKLLCFYKKDNNIYLSKYEDYKVIEEKIIISCCETLNSVILSKDNSISIIYINLKGELFLNTFINDNIVSSVFLTRAVSDYNYMQIASVNNSLNIFYINEVNTISTLCFRVLSNTLTLTPALIIDRINTKCEIPYVISATNNSLSVCYLKIGCPNSIGYRTFNFKSNSWSSFKELDKFVYPIKSINFITNNEVIAYSYTFTKNRKETIICGIGKDNIKNNTIEEISSNIYLNELSISQENKLNIIYIIRDRVKIKELEINNEIRYMDEVKLNRIMEAKKYYFACDKDISKNSIIIIKSDEGSIYIDSSFIERIIIEKYKKNMDIPRNSNNIVVSAEELKEKISTLNLNNNSDDRYSIKTFISKIKIYESDMNKLTEKFIESDEEKKKLLENINYLNEQINRKDYEINRFESILTEKQSVVNTYERRIEELTNLLKSNNEKEFEIEINKLKEIIKENEYEKVNNINEVKAYINKIQILQKKIQELTNIIKANSLKE